MARFDVYPNPDGTGYLLDVQADLLSHLNTRIVVPLLPPDEAPRPAQRLNPSFRVGASDLVMVTQFLAAVPSSMLKTPSGTLLNRHSDIVAAVDFLMQGF
jgi:toxin CcdB